MLLILVPIGTFEERARKLLGDVGFEDLLEVLAKRPRTGRLIQGAGGLRKMRFARPGGGKSGGSRVIYYYHDDHNPLFLLLIYAKANQENLTNAQKAQLRKYVDGIVDEFD